MMIVNAIYRNCHQLFPREKYILFLFPYFILWMEGHKCSPHSSGKEIKHHLLEWREFMFFTQNSSMRKICLFSPIYLIIYLYQSGLCFILWFIIQILCLLFYCSSCSIGVLLRLASVFIVPKRYAQFFCFLNTYFLLRHQYVDN